MKNLIARILAIWALLVFTVSLLIIFIPVWATRFWPEPKRSYLNHPIFSAWMKLFFTLTGVRRTFTGKHHFQKGENYIVVCNHCSLMDPPISTVAIPRPNKTIAKVEFARVPFFGIIYKRGSVLVDRRSDESRKASFARMKDVLTMGLDMCIYPEGTRNKSKQPLQNFHDGAFRLAIDSGKEMIPAVIFNSAKVLPPGKGLYFWPAPVEMHFLQPVSPLGKSMQQLKEEVYEILSERIIAGPIRSR
jgi:1-acyl-sn-glycerol-3-phosphate acyltransferase